MENIFKNRLRDLRKDKNLTQLKLSRLLQTSRSTIANWESGQSKPENTEVYYKVAKVLDTTVEKGRDPQ